LNDSQGKATTSHRPFGEPPSRRLQWDADLTHRFWNYESQHPAHYFTFRYGNKIAKRLRQYLAGCKTVLDFGCGPGFLVPHLLHLGLTVTGADFSKDSVAMVNKQSQMQRNCRGAFHVDELLLRKERYDAVIAVEVIEHLNDQHLTITLDMVKGLVSKGGVVIFTTPNEEDLDAETVFCPMCEHVFHRWQHVRSWTRDSLVDCLKHHGYEVFDVFTTDFSANLLRSSVRALRQILGRGNGVKDPHLVCVCHVPNA